VLKLARGHAAFELGEPRLEQPARIAFAPLETMATPVREDFEAPSITTIWPEVGSRAMQRMAVAFPYCYGPDWVEVQPERYRYLTSVSEGVVIRMVLSEYLGCEVVWV